jgi:hypothetical protein
MDLQGLVQAAIAMLESVPDNVPGSLPPLAVPPLTADDEAVDEEEDPCAGARRGVFEAQSRVDTYDAQLEYYRKQLEKMRPEADRLYNEAANLANEAQREFAWHLIEKAFMKVANYLLGPLGLLLNPTGYVVGSVPGSGYVSFFQEMHGMLDIVTGDLSTIEKVANENGLRTVQRFVETVRQLEALAARGLQVGRKMAEIEVERDRWQEELDRRQAELDACMASAQAAA